MTKNRFGNGGSRGGRSARGKRRGEAKRTAPHATGASATADSGTPGDGDAGVEATTGAGAATCADSRTSDPGVGGTSGADPAAGDGAAVGAEAAAAGAADAGASQDAARSDVAEAAQIEQLSAQIAALQHELLRKQADFENFRKRINRDKEEAIKFANSGLLLDLTAVLDDFERAISAAALSEDFATLHSGIELIEKHLLSTLQRKWGLTRFDSAGKPFDPERHEALATEPSAEHTETTVIEDYQKGYTLHGRVIRAARVRVATPLESGDGGHDPDPDAAGAGEDGSLEEGA